MISTAVTLITTIPYYAYTFWLFLRSDIPTFVIPSCIFGLSAALSETLTLSSNLASQNTSSVLSNISKLLLFTFQTCLVFDIANQSTPGAEKEDAINKPWRPIPAKRISQSSARNLLLGLIPLVLTSSFLLGVYIETCTLLVLCWMYNDLNGGDVNFWTRNLHLSVAYFLYNLGSLKVAVGGAGAVVTVEGYAWTGVVSLVVFTTMHIQDIKDQGGDGERGRCTVPLVLGDGLARWSIAGPVVFWMVVCPVLWRCGILGWIACVGSGGLVVSRLLLFRNVEADKKTYNLWALWLTVLYSMPVWPEQH